MARGGALRSWSCADGEPLRVIEPRAAVNAVVASTTDLAVISIFSESLASSVLTSASGAVLPDAKAARTRSAAAVTASSAFSLALLMALAPLPSETLRGCAPFDPSR